MVADPEEMEQRLAAVKRSDVLIGDSFFQTVYSSITLSTTMPFQAT